MLTPDHVLAFLISGVVDQGDITFVGLDSRSHPLREGSAVFVPAGRFVRSRMRSCGPVRHVRIALSPCFVVDVARRAGMGDEAGIQLAANAAICNPEILRIASAIAEEVAHRRRGYKDYLEGLAQCLAVQLIRDQLVRRDDAPPITQTNANSWRIRRAIDNMVDRLAETVRIDDLAGAAGLSPFHFFRQFKFATGLTPYRYLTRLRMERGKALLIANRDSPIADIAALIGYRSESQFSRAFRRYSGQSPSRFRRMST